MLVRLLRGSLAPYRGLIAVVVVLQFVQTLAALWLPTLNADIIDVGIVTGDSGYILQVGAVMLAVSLAQVVCQAGAVGAGARAASWLGRDLRSAVFDRVQSFSAQEVGRFGTPSLITRTTNDVQQVQLLVLMTLTMMVSAPIMAGGGVLLALRLDVPLSASLLVAVPALTAFVGAVIVLMRPLFRLVQERLDRITRVLREQITGLRVVRAFVREDMERARFARANGDLFDVSVAVGRLMALMFPGVMLVLNVSSVAVLWFGGIRISAGELQVGELTAYLSYLMQILMSVMMATFMFMMVPRAEVSAERIMQVLDTESSVPPPARPVRPQQVRGLLELRGVGFRYPGAERPVLQGVDLITRPGEVTAVIGSTGSGKSTLVSVVARLMDATEGEVLLDGVPVRDLDPEVLSAAVALVPQQPYLFSGTIASNLRYGDPDADDDRLWHALEVAQAKDFVTALDGGLDAPVIQGGTNVSGGQRQRLAIARALVSRAAVYLFDDAFSALDTATDAALRAALARETVDASVVIVAQRVATIRSADRIVVLDGGRVTATGTHDELMALDPTYRDIVLSQLGEAPGGAGEPASPGVAGLSGGRGAQA